MSLRKAVFSLRPEEAITLVFFLPMAYALAGMAAVRPVLDGPAAGYPGSLARLIALCVATGFFLWMIRYRPRWEFLRDAMPFVFCANVYANLHDLIRFYGAPDITEKLYRWDVAIFGFEPTVWAAQFLHPLLTDFFTFAYWSFYFVGPLLGLFLYLKRDRIAFRATMVSIVFCLYLGYIGYVAWPASAPRLWIPNEYATDIRGFSAFLDATRAATAAVPLTAKGAFPSLHCALALLTILLAWRYLRWFFWAQLPLGVGLILGTVYLRHHWVVDILAGFVLTAMSFAWGPWLEEWWAAQTARFAREDEPESPPAGEAESLPAARSRAG